jgi:hypothetical protein
VYRSETHSELQTAFEASWEFRRFTGGFTKETIRSHLTLEQLLHTKQEGSRKFHDSLKAISRGKIKRVKIKK